jgi:hypothetical protein
MANDLRVVIIKFADRLHNLRTLEHVREDKRERIALESIQIYAPLANRLGMGKLKGEIEDTAFPYAYPKEYAQIEELLKEKSEFYKKELEEVHVELEKVLNHKILMAVMDENRTSLPAAPTRAHVPGRTDVIVARAVKAARDTLPSDNDSASIAALASIVNRALLLVGLVVIVLGAMVGVGITMRGMGTSITSTTTAPAAPVVTP